MNILNISMIVQRSTIFPLREVRESGVCEGDVEKNILNISMIVQRSTIPPLREVRESGVCEGDVEKKYTEYQHDSSAFYNFPLEGSPRERSM